MRAVAVQVVLVVCAVLGVPSLAQAESTRTDTEVLFLFSHLKQSACEFSRNGTWYSADEAAKHMQRKYDYLKKRNAVATTEQFIERVATESSMTGKPYLVRCLDQPVVQSAPWFKAALDRFRKPG